MTSPSTPARAHAAAGRSTANRAVRLAAYKVPAAVEFLSPLPREDSGKIFKRRLRDPYWQAAGRRI
jgi:acyl-coenzyme A synthetase/AMP-(fatty) acid ligase